MRLLRLSLNNLHHLPLHSPPLSSPPCSESGVFKDDCGADVDHAIVLVGYGTDASAGDYWLIRNSWSSGWGEAGYIRLARYGDTPAGEPCLIDNTPGDGDGCKGGPATEKVCGICGIMSDSSYPTGAKLA